ncbi:MAG: NAD(P)/FAD-dependent oxidoreductase [Sulfobacillus benefaciens]|uniref:Pyridine nucleotide-disulfide oxidoreductase domain-containing protein 2 n=1 Tax=Sulfobacillus benefaciens TaxID=453960 RepID=A0A2T2XJ56_9FIRM|nr:MAG: NAD(P)/FAD-dependent oxidoreductase [Sulfobacillus benefaciens]
MSDADVVVIGSGHNGLSAAMYLAKAGWKVVVLEQSQVPGGAAKSGEVTKPGFIHDLYATNLGLFLGSPVYRDFGPMLTQSGLALEVSSEPYASVFPHGTALSMYTDAEKSLASIANFSPEDAEAWQHLVDYFQRVSPYLFPLLQMPVPSFEFGRGIFRMTRALGWTGTQELLSLLLQSPREFVESWFSSKEMQALLIPWGFHLDYGPDVSGGATFPFLESVADHLNGMAIARGGIGLLVHSMINIIKGYGGQVEVNAPVTQILTDNAGHATGVKLSDGRTIAARRAVLANVNIRTLFESLVDPTVVNHGFLKRIQKFRFGPGTMMVHLALSGEVPWLNPSVTRSMYVHIGPYVNDVARTYQQAVAGYLPDSPLLVVGQQSQWDHSRAPDGMHTVWIQVRAVPGHPIGDAAGSIVTTDWSTMGPLYAQRVLDKLEEYAPGVTSRILAMTVMTPQDLQNDNPNLVGGDSISGSHHLDQFYFLRPVPGWSRYRTPVPGLWVVGASTWPGGGLNAVSGYLAAQALLKSRGRH